ncbi:uncharacterized protein TM35_001041070 [Trypanosoma theileri]|uniref:Mucin-associated surface protein (MASP) n=1 Tax=Trypanosoma theileri TaxID=67003 RepID=A0A1X0NEE7_9TRYP|nr:uncharacterized protein TM35_001041070 [Trypanosoma theileri]ORC81923.1 hypothetical protein TM35_001041070 [Trypanosoma theileri]
MMMMMMMMSRVMCVLAVVLCCMSVGGATSNSGVENDLKEINDLGKRAIAFAEATKTAKEETLKLNGECSSAAKNANDLTGAANEFVHKIDKLLAKPESVPSVLETEKIKGDELLEKVKKAAAYAKNIARLTKAAKKPIIENGEAARQLLIDFNNSYKSMTSPNKGGDKEERLKELKKKVDTAFPNTNEDNLAQFVFAGIDAADEAQAAAKKAEDTVEPAETAANLLDKALKKIEDAVNAAKEKSKERPPQETQGSSNNKQDQSSPIDSTSTKQPSPANRTATPDSQENNSTTSPISENTVTEAPPTTPSPAPLPNADTNNIVSTVQNNKANVDSSVSPVWMRTAAPLLIVAVLFSVTLY